MADVAAATIFGYVTHGDICIFHNNPPGQHGSLVNDGDRDVNPGADESLESAGTTALAAGLTAGAIGMVGGPVTALAAAGVAAYGGSLIGALGGAGEQQTSRAVPHLRPAGVILAVRIVRPTSKQRVVSDLRNSGAEDIEQAEGEWLNGDWIDYNPEKEVNLVSTP